MLISSWWSLPVSLKTVLISWRTSVGWSKLDGVSHSHVFESAELVSANYVATSRSWAVTFVTTFLFVAAQNFFLKNLQNVLMHFVAMKLVKVNKKHSDGFFWVRKIYYQLITRLWHYSDAVIKHHVTPGKGVQPIVAHFIKKVFIYLLSCLFFEHEKKKANKAKKKKKGEKNRKW